MSAQGVWANSGTASKRGRRILTDYCVPEFDSWVKSFRTARSASTGPVRLRMAAYPAMIGKGCADLGDPMAVARPAPVIFGSFGHRSASQVSFPTLICIPKSYTHCMRRILAFWILAQPAFSQGAGIWEIRAPYPVTSTEVSGAAIDGFVYVVCGLTPQGSSSRLYRYDPRADAWVERAPVPIEGGADHCNVAAAGGRLYVLGAIRIGSTFIDGDTWEYDPAQDRWQNVGRMSTPRGASGVAVSGTNIYVAGGLAASGTVDDFETFDTATRQWRRLPALPIARDHLTAQVINGRFYAIAGRRTVDLTANEEYDIATGQWRARAPIPTARGGLGSGTVDNRIQVFGGEGNSGTAEGTFAQNQEYDPATDTWRSLAPMPTPRHGLYGITVGRAIFAPSGGPRAGANYTVIHEAFFLPPSQPPSVDPGRIGNAANGRQPFAPGTLITIYGNGLAPATQVAGKTPLPVQMNGVTVKLNGSPIPLYAVAPEQISCLVPLDVTTVSSIVVNYAGSESPAVPIGANAFRLDPAPAIFTLSSDGQGAVLIGGTGMIARAPVDSQSRPARRGEIIEIYATGLGAVSNPPGFGQAGVVDPLSRTLGTAIAMLGTVRATVLYSGLAPGLPGVYQVNVLIPQGVSTGERVPLTIQVNEQGLLSNTVTIAVQ